MAIVTLLVPADLPPTTADRLVIEVRDVSQLDAPSVVVTSRVLDGVRLEPGARLQVSLDVPSAPPGHTYGLRVHADIAGTGAVSPGDLLNTQAHPVPDASSATVEIPLARV